ncbi:MAG: tRNA pseudouridine(55) synthase TruB [Synergistetes bacterium]|nr:tRNA pseudouridine(55) synthase TruB [Synergistota bacterium]MCX8128186.1 tRNA pseudouridine(55) synthase TruB [Synergistota bacterium]MDW8192562.1 tRNA pseudouridine(55) synthase TruB [Synergistota bacterium]
MEGVVKVYKPLLITSTDCLEEVKSALGVKKAGHTGTLDPHAEGLLLVCLNSATKLVPFLLQLDKEYIGEAILGVKTSTGDRGGTVLEVNTQKVNLDALLEVINGFKGRMKQVPPLYSAIKIGGKRLYEYAREGLDGIEVEPREIYIYEFEVLSFEIGDFPKFSFRLRCSKGTYVRKLIEDIGDTLGCGAFLYSLKRTKIGPFSVEGASTPWNREKLLQAMLSNEEAVRMIMPIKEVSKEEARKLLNGMNIEASEDYGGLVGIFYTGTLIAIAQSEEGLLRPIRVFKL